MLIEFRVFEHNLIVLSSKLCAVMYRDVQLTGRRFTAVVNCRNVVQAWKSWVTVLH